MVEETETKDDWPVVVIEPKVPLPEVFIVVPVAFVKVNPWSVETPVILIVDAWRLPVLVALVKASLAIVEELTISSDDDATPKEDICQ